MLSSDDIEKILRQHFQKDITLLVDNIEYKKGKFIVAQSTLLSNNYYFEFHIKTDKKIEAVRVPYPFDVEYYSDENLIYFDYRIQSMTKNNELSKILEGFSETQEGFSQNKLYNKILEIEFK